MQTNISNATKSFEKILLDEKSSKNVMISYSWSNRKEVNEIVDVLEPFVNIWRDKSNLAGKN